MNINTGNSNDANSDRSTTPGADHTDLGSIIKLKGDDGSFDDYRQAFLAFYMSAKYLFSCLEETPDDSDAETEIESLPTEKAVSLAFIDLAASSQIEEEHEEEGVEIPSMANSGLTPGRIADKANVIHYTKPIEKTVLMYVSF